MSELIPVEQVEQIIAVRVSERVAVLEREIARLTQALTDQIVPLQEALAHAKQVIAKLQTQLYGTRAETSQVVLTAEGQQFIDTTWGISHETTPAPPADERREQVVRTPRDRDFYNSRAARTAGRGFRRISPWHARCFPPVRETNRFRQGDTP